MTSLSEFVVHVLRPLWGVLAMVLFLGIVAWAYWPRNRDKLQSHADIPLRDDDKER